MSASVCLRVCVCVKAYALCLMSVEFNMDEGVAKPISWR